MMIARRACADWGRARKRRPKVQLDDIDLPKGSSGLCDEEMRDLLDAIRQLPAKERTALHLFYLMEQPASAAREIMGLSNSGFYKVLERAKNRVASILQGRKGVR